MLVQIKQKHPDRVLCSTKLREKRISKGLFTLFALFVTALVGIGTADALCTAFFLTDKIPKAGRRNNSQNQNNNCVFHSYTLALFLFFSDIIAITAAIAKTAAPPQIAAVALTESPEIREPSVKTR